MEKIEKLQRISCLLLDEFIRKCNKEGLCWFVDAGTLLGTIRHGGFIPWDDDVDVVMPRKDYNFLYEHGDLIFKEPFCLLTSKNNFADTLTMKLCYTESTFIYPRHLSYFYRKDGYHFDIPRGIAMDIVPIDHVPSNLEERKKLLHLIDFIYDGCIIVDTNCRNNVQRLNYLSKYNKGAELYKEIMTDVDSKNKEFIACTPWWTFYNSRNAVVPSKCYSEFIEKTFEGCEEKIRVPVGYDDVLKSYYGEYMVEQKRGIDWCNHLIDDKNSYRYYEQYTNEEIIKIIKNGG